MDKKAKIEEVLKKRGLLAGAPQSAQIDTEKQRIEQTFVNRGKLPASVGQEPLEAAYQASFAPAVRAGQGLAKAYSNTNPSKLLEKFLQGQYADVAKELIAPYFNALIEDPALARDIGIAPITAVTAPVGAPMAALMAQTGISEAIGKAIQPATELPVVGEYVQPALEIAGVAGLKGVKMPVKPKTINVTPLSKGLEKGASVTPANIGQDIAVAADVAKKEASKAYDPVTAQMLKGKAKGVGKSASDKFMKELNATIKERGGISAQELKKIKAVADEVTKEGTTPVKAWGARQIMDRKFKEIFKDNLDFADVQIKRFREILTDEIADNLPPDVALKWRELNKNFYELNDALEPLAKIKNTADEQIFNKILINGSNAIEKVKGKLGDDLIEGAGYNYIAGKVFNETGEFSGKAYKNVIKQIGDDKGRAIFGVEQWQGMKDFVKIINAQEAIPDLISKVPVVNKLGFTQIPSVINKFNITRLVEKGGKVTTGKLKFAKNVIDDALLLTGKEETQRMEKKKQRSGEIVNAMTKKAKKE